MIKIENDVKKCYNEFCKIYEKDKRVAQYNVENLFFELISDYCVKSFKTTYYIFDKGKDISMLIHAYDNEINQHYIYVIDYDDFEISKFDVDEIAKLIDCYC